MKNPTSFDDRFWAKFVDWMQRMEGMTVSEENEVIWLRWLNCFAAGNIAGLEIRLEK